MPPSAPTAPPARRWPLLALATLLVLAAFTAIGVHGVRQEAAGARVLPQFTPVFEAIRDVGGGSQEWMQAHRLSVALAGTIALAAIALAALRAQGRRGTPVVLLAAAFAAAAWGQALLQSDQLRAGVACYGIAFAAALVLGAWRPLRSLPGWPTFPPDGTTSPPLAWRWEVLIVTALTLGGLLARTWALTELYDFFDLETINWMIQGRTWHGYLGYLDFGFVQNNGGAVQLLPTQVVFRLFGTSIFTLRLTSVLVSVIAIPLMYWLGRRIAGITGGTIAALLIASAPEQLFWARNENLHFAPIALCALITAHVCLWLAQRLSGWAVVATALWMPWCRWFYSASVVAFLIPIAVSVHAMLTGPRLWRKAWYVLPGLAAGMVLWLFSLTAMKAALHDGEWRFVDPSAFYGASAWRKQGEFRDASTVDLIRLQAVSLTTNFVTVLENMAYHTANFSHWCQRAQPAAHKTILNVGVTLILFVGLGYLIGQWTDRRAFLLFAWWGIAILPAILSQDPADRRMAMVFPATHAICGVAVAAFLRLVAAYGGRLAERLSLAVAAVGLAVVIATNLSSHLLLPVNPVMFHEYPRILAPMIARGDMIVTNVEAPFRNLGVLGNLDRFIEAPACIREVPPHQWLQAGLAPRCAYEDEVYSLIFPPERVAALRHAPPPRHITYLLRDDPESRADIALLRALYPDAVVTSYEIGRASRQLIGISVAADAAAQLHEPVVDGVPANEPLPVLLADTPLRRGETTTADGGIRVTGGVLLDRDGWYTWRLEPPCDGARLRIDDEAADAAPRPLLAGVHAFALHLADTSGCALPLRMVRQGATDNAGAQVVSADQFVGPHVATDPGLRAAPLATWSGYEQPRPVLQTRVGRPLDFGVDAAGHLSLLMQLPDRWQLKRFDPQGQETASWDVETPLNFNLNTIAVAPDGTTAIPVQQTVHLYGPSGDEIGAFTHPWIVWESQFQFLGNDVLLVSIPHRGSIIALNRRGELLAEVTTPDGAPAAIYSPVAMTVGADGTLVVGQADGTLLSLRLDGPAFAPRFVAAFAAVDALPGISLDGAGRIVVPTDGGLHVLDRNGIRLLAATPQRDPAQMGFGKRLRARYVGDRLYLLDSDRNTLWTLQD